MAGKNSTQFCVADIQRLANVIDDGKEITVDAPVIQKWLAEHLTEKQQRMLRTIALNADYDERIAAARAYDAAIKLQRADERLMPARLEAAGEVFMDIAGLALSVKNLTIDILNGDDERGALCVATRALAEKIGYLA